MSGGPRAGLDAVVVGAGISGLTAAFHLVQAGARVAVLEAANRVGGAVETWRDGGWLFELGPNTVLDNHPAVGALIAAAGLTGERIEATPAAKRRYLWKGDRLVPLPGGPPGLLTTPLFPFAAKLRLLREPWIAPAPAGASEAGGEEESIAAFVRRRLGGAFLDYAVGPFVSGVYAGDPERLSVRWATPKIWALEQEHGSLIRGALARRKGPAPGGAMISFTDGLATLPDRLAARINEASRSARAVAATDAGDAAQLADPSDAGNPAPAAADSGKPTGLGSLDAPGTPETAAAPGLYLGTRCTRIVRDEGRGFRVETAGGPTYTAPRVIVAVPADVTAELLADATAGASRALAEVPYAPVVVAALGFRRVDVAHPLDGFGFLAPRSESLRILGCLFPASLFPGRAPAAHVALSAFAGGRTDPTLVDWPEERLLDLVLTDLRRALGLRGDPLVVRLRRWPRAIPQYELGHARFVDLARQIERDLPGLAIAGNFTGGISVPDCIARGAAAGSAY